MTIINSKTDLLPSIHQKPLEKGLTLESILLRLIGKNNGLNRLSLNKKNHTEFRQYRLMQQLLRIDCAEKPTKHEYRPLIKKMRKYNGLCELICNNILIEGWMSESKKNNFLRTKISLQNLNETRIINSHLLDVYSIFAKILAKIFHIYPSNIFSYREQRKLVIENKNGNKVINNTILEKKLDQIKIGTTLKVEIIFRTFFSLSGHSTLLKKDHENSYTYFDPERGTDSKLTKNQVCFFINLNIKKEKASDIFMINGEDYLKKLKNKNII